jgi:HlyD family secretion protein
MSAQDAVSHAQDALQKSIGELAATVSAAASQVDAPSKGQQDSTPTAATIASDQAAVDSANADLLSARQSLAQATLTAPIAGTVASVDAAAGDSVSAGGTVLVIIGSGAAVVDTTVPVERIAEIKVGQHTTVTPTGSPTGVAGTVSRIGRLVDDSADSVAYPVTITVDDPPASMPAGSSAAVDIVIDTAENVLTVPTSALHRGNPVTVTVLSGTATTPRDVTVGATGPLRTEITGGLEPGDKVVLADFDEPLPTGDDQNRSPTGFIGKGPQGAGPRSGGGR